MLKEKPWKQKTAVPQLFKSIMQNDELRRVTKSSQVVNFAEHKRLYREHQDFMRAAEKVVAGTKDKGGALA